MKANISRSEFTTFLRYNNMHKIADSVQNRSFKYIDGDVLGLITHEIKSLRSQLTHALYKVSLLQEKEYVQNKKGNELYDAINPYSKDYTDDILINIANSLSACGCHGEDHDYDHDIEGGTDNE